MIALARALLVGGFCVAARAKVEELDDARALTFQIKTNDAIVVGMFEKKGSKEEQMLRQAAQDMAPSGGIQFFVSYDAKTAKKYLGGGDLPDGPPAIAVFCNFDPETGTSKKHVKGKAFSADFESYANIYKFIFIEALPIVTRIPINMGPDPSRRVHIAGGSGLPKLYRFSKAELSKDPEAQDADGAFLRASAKLKGTVTPFAVMVTGNEHDEGANYLEGFGKEVDDLGSEPIIVFQAGGTVEDYEGEIDDDIAIAEFATTLAADAEVWEPKAGPAVGKKKKKKKSKSDL